MDILDADQGAAIDEAVFTYDELMADGFVTVIKLMTKYARYDHGSFTARLKDALTRAGAFHVDRSVADDSYNQESTEVRELLDPATEWADGVVAQFKLEAHRDAEAARQASIDAPLPVPAADAPPKAEHYLGRLVGNGDRPTSYRGVLNRLSGVLSVLGTIPDLASFGIDADELAEGTAWRAALMAGRTQAVGARTQRGALTDDLKKALADINGLMTEIKLMRERTISRVRRALPGFDLTLIRGAWANPAPRAEVPQAAQSAQTPAVAETGM